MRDILKNTLKELQTIKCDTEKGKAMVRGVIQTICNNLSWYSGNTKFTSNSKLSESDLQKQVRKNLYSIQVGINQVIAGGTLLKKEISDYNKITTLFKNI